MTTTKAAVALAALILGVFACSTKSSEGTRVVESASTVGPNPHNCRICVETWDVGTKSCIPTGWDQCADGRCLAVGVNCNCPAACDDCTEICDVGAPGGPACGPSGRRLCNSGACTLNAPQECPEDCNNGAGCPACQDCRRDLDTNTMMCKPSLGKKLCDDGTCIEDTFTCGAPPPCSPACLPCTEVCFNPGFGDPPKCSITNGSICKSGPSAGKCIGPYDSCDSLPVPPPYPTRDCAGAAAYDNGTSPAGGSHFTTCSPSTGMCPGGTSTIWFLDPPPPAPFNVNNQFACCCSSGSSTTTSTTQTTTDTTSTSDSTSETTTGTTSITSTDSTGTYTTVTSTTSTNTSFGFRRIHQ